MKPTYPVYNEETAAKEIHNAVKQLDQKYKVFTKLLSDSAPADDENFIKKTISDALDIVREFSHPFGISMPQFIKPDQWQQESYEGALKYAEDVKRHASRYNQQLTVVSSLNSHKKVLHTKSLAELESYALAKGLIGIPLEYQHKVRQAVAASDNPLWIYERLREYAKIFN